MSDDTQTQILHIVSAVIKRKGAWAWIMIPAAIVALVSATVSLFTYNVLAVNYLESVNYARNNTPLLVKAVREIDDTLKRAGYEIAQFTPVP